MSVGLGLELVVYLRLVAFALGLGQIVVKSRPGQPLLAEIPIISSDPEELQGLQAQLASPETFARVGLAPPTGLVADLDFSFDQDATGHPLIRVTTQQPVQQPELVFLLEVDWGSGRLVREYSALVDTPQSVAALRAHRLIGFTAPAHLNRWPLRGDGEGEATGTAQGGETGYTIEPALRASSGETIRQLVLADGTGRRGCGAADRGRCGTRRGGRHGGHPANVTRM